MSNEAEEFERLIGDQWVTLGRSLKELFNDGKKVSLTIDGQSVEMNRVIPRYDAMGRWETGRKATVYDAVNELYLSAISAPEGAAAKEAEEAPEADRPVPVLCHREHMRPAAVCRVCLVEIKGARLLVPACHEPIVPGMVVSTIRTSQRVRKAVGVVTELLLADHQTLDKDHDSATAGWREFGRDELKLLEKRLKLSGSRFPSSGIDRGQDVSSPVIAVDHNACILCDRCVRACNEVKENGVLARMNKGYGARIAFDLNDQMGESSCVACGECMISCPTGALSNRKVINIEWEQEPTDERPRFPAEPVAREDLLRHPLFEEISLPFLDWNRTAIRRRRYARDEVVCRVGDFGATAFLIESGTFVVQLNAAKGRAAVKGAGGVLSWFRRGASAGAGTEAHLGGAPLQTDGHLTKQFTRDDLIFGEIACMSQHPRTATITAASDDCQVLEILRNVLYMLQRTRSSKMELDRLYRERSVDTHLRTFPLFAGLPRGVSDAMHEFLKERVKLIRCHPGQVIFREGDRADHFYMVRIGFVKVSQKWPGGERVTSYIGPARDPDLQDCDPQEKAGDSPDGFFGEIALMAQVPALKEALGIRGDKRTATCTALDHVDLVRIDGDDFKHLLRAFLLDQSVLNEVSGNSKVQLAGLLEAMREAGPSINVAERIAQTAHYRLESNRAAQTQLESAPLGDFLTQGLMEADSLLVLDLEKCTRCDECVKACADIHRDPVSDGPVTRLIRDGLRFDKYLVASSCRSCLDPYCMVGCPVGSIQRMRNGTILIRDWCVGCGLCERNCPYGNIVMHESPARAEGKAIAITCDRCASADHDPRCVYACPHDAAHRMEGRELLKIVGAQTFVAERK